MSCGEGRILFFFVGFSTDLEYTKLQNIYIYMIVLLFIQLSHSSVFMDSDFPFVVDECGYKESKEAVSLIASKVPLSPDELEWIMGRTASELFQGHWLCS